MKHYHATPKGNIPFTEEEEAEYAASATNYNLQAAARAEQSVRDERNYLLAQTDWMALSDVSMPEEWKTYRQELRDISDQEGFPFDIVFPTKPSAFKEVDLSEEKGTEEES